MPRVTYSYLVIGNRDVYNGRNAPSFGSPAISGKPLPAANIPAKITKVGISWTVRDNWMKNIILWKGDTGDTRLGSASFGAGWGNLSTRRALYQGGLPTITMEGDGGTAGTLKSGSSIVITIDWQYTDVPSTLTVGDADAGTAAAASIRATFSNYRHRIRYQLGEAATDWVELPAGTLTHEQEIPLNWCGQIPGTTSATATATLESWDGERKIGSRTAAFTVRVPESVKPEISGISVTPMNQLWGLTLQGVSGAGISVAAAGAYGSTVAGYEISVDGKRLTTNPASVGVLERAGRLPVSVTVTDSRGRKATGSAEISVTAYSPPTIAEASAARCSADGTSNGTGTRIGVTCAAVWSAVGGNAITVTVERQSGESWESLYSGAAWDGVKVLDQTFTVERSYTVRITAADAAGKVSRVTKTIPTGHVFMRWDAGMESLGLGGYPEKRKALELKGWDFYLKDGRELASALENKSDAGHRHTADDVEGLSAAISSAISAAIAAALAPYTGIRDLSGDVTNKPGWYGGGASRLTVRRAGCTVFINIRTDARKWKSGDLLGTLPEAARPAEVIDCAFVMGSQDYGLLRIQPDGSVTVAGVSNTSASKSIFFHASYPAADAPMVGGA